MTSAQTPLGPSGVLNMLIRLLFSVPLLLFTVIRGLPIAIRRGVSIKSWLLSAFYRVVMGYLKPGEIQYLAAPARQVYPRWLAKKRANVTRLGEASALNRLVEDVEPLDEMGARIMWLRDRKKATKVVLFFHGGGYVAPILKGHFTWCWNCYVGDSSGMKSEVAVAILEYTLCPQAQYPSQH